MKCARGILIASFVICLASFALAQAGSSGGGGTNAFASSVVSQSFSNVPAASSCTGNFALGHSADYKAI